MGRRSKEDSLDWDAIERKYRLGKLSLKQLAVEYGTHASTISRRAQKYGWVQDKSEEVDAVTKSLLIQHASGNANPNATPSALEVKAAAQMGADVVLEHRAGLKKLRRLQDKLLTHLESVVDNFEDVGVMIQILRREDERGIDRVNDAMRKAMERSDVVDDLKRLSEVDERIRKGEREAFGLDDKAKQSTPFEDLLARLGAEQETK